MTEFEAKMLQEIKALTQKVERLECASNINQVTYFENLRSDAIVGADYVAYRFNCSESAVIRGRFGTDQIRRIRNKPLRFIKREVDSVFREMTRPPEDKAAFERFKKKLKSSRS